MKYYLYMVQSGRGCDYTIGCGTKLELLPKTISSREAAIAHVIGLPQNWKEDFEEDNDEDYVREYLLDTGLLYVDDSRDEMLDACSLLEVSKETDLLPILRAKIEEVRTYADSKRNKALEAREKAEYERLKKKFKGK
jgi:hypothetical protein